MESIRVPRSRAAQTHSRIRDEILAAIEPLLFKTVGHAAEVRSGLERAFAASVQQRYACAVHSATIGLFLALRTVGVKPGDEVITVGNSDISTTAAISHCGATPVLCDVLESDSTIDLNRVEHLITKRTRAVLPVDLYGHPADVRGLRSIAERHGLRVVEDAALATGAADYGRPVGAFADITVFSFAPFKPLGCAGNGAMLVTDNPALAERLQLLSGYGHAHGEPGWPAGHQSHVAEGYNVPIDPLEAALLTVKLPHIREWTEKRRAVAAAYARGLADTGAILPRFRRESAPTFRSYTIRVRNQPLIYQGLREAGIEAVLHYVPPIYKQPVYGGYLPGADNLPVTDRIADELICLPVTPELEESEVEHVVNTMRVLLDRFHKYT